MTFLSPLPALLAAAVAMPLLVLLYFLKLRRHPLRIASTLLWLKSTEDLQANVPFQRLRWSVLLVLQVLLLLAVLAALARPVIYGQTAGSSRMILLIDRSASMNARDAASGTRLDAAKNAAREAVQRLGRRSEPAEIMVVAFAASAQVVSGFESNRRLLLDAIDRIGPTDQEGNLNEALALAGAFAGQNEAVDEPPPPPDIVLFSDGRFREPEAGGFTLPAGTLRFIAVGPDDARPVNNLGIAAFSARRDYQDPTRVIVFARLVNAAAQAIETTATLRIDGEPARTKAVQVPASGDQVGQASVTFTLELARGALLTLSISRLDDLAADNTAALVLHAPARPRIALVHPGDGPDPFLHDLLLALEPRTLVPVAAPAEGELAIPWAGDEFDVLVFDRVAAPRVPEIPSVTFGAAPQDANVEIRAPTRTGGYRVLSWDRQHPVLRHVSLDALVYAGFGGYVLPAGATPLAFGPQGPIMAVLDPGGPTRHVIVGFPMTQSNWPVHVSSAVFMKNALDYLTRPGGSAAGGASTAFRPGEPITVRVRPESRQLTIEGPINMTIEVEPGALATLPALRRVGVYAVRGAEPDRIALTLASDVESDIRPRRSLVVNAQQTGSSTVRAAAPLELWPWLAGAAIGLLVLEWVVYCAQMRG